MINPLEKISQDFCFICNTKNIECYDLFDNPLNYTLLLNRVNNGNTVDTIFNSNREFGYFRCKKCGTIYRMDWRNGIYPIPLRDSFVFNDFTNRY